MKLVIKNFIYIYIYIFIFIFLNMKIQIVIFYFITIFLHVIFIATICNNLHYEVIIHKTLKTFLLLIKSLQLKV